MSFAMTFIFFMVAIVGRVIKQYQLTGDYGLRAKWHPTSKMENIVSVIAIMTLIGAFVLSAFVSFLEFDVQLELGFYWQMVGVGICLIGTMLTSISQMQMGKEWRIGVDNNEQTNLVTQGIYSCIRNPIYTGVMIFCLGQLILIPHWIMLTIVACGYIAIELHVRKIEEPYLESLHGEKFLEYKKTAGRYIPSIKNRL